MPLYWIWFSLLEELTPWQKIALLKENTDPEELYFKEEKTGDIPLNKDLGQAEDILVECKRKNVDILPFDSDRYPARLREIEDPPVLLYYRGILPDWDAQPVIGVVGTRKATGYGLQQAFRMGKQIAQCGGMVVSGGAYGIDTKAMEGALEAGKPVVGVLGCGADVIYPRTNRRLFARVMEDGCLLSEYPPGTAPLGWHFPRRNRILSGISHGILVVEAPEKSGALSTADHAYKQGRDVYVLPANVGVSAYAGNAFLLQQGCTPVICGWDAVKSYGLLFPDLEENHREPVAPVHTVTPLKVAEEPVIPEKSQKISIDNSGKSSYSVLNGGEPALTDEEQGVLALISRHPVHSDQVAEKSDLSPSKVQSILTKLTIKGLVQHHPGGLVSLK